MRSLIAVLPLLALTTALASGCSRADLNFSRAQGADQDELKEAGDPLPPFEKLVRRDPETGRDVLKIVVMTPGDEQDRDGSPVHQTMQQLRAWLKSDKGIMGKAKEEASEMGEGAAFDDMYKLTSQDGRRLGALPGSVDWDVKIFSGMSGAHQDEWEPAVKDASIVIANAKDPWWQTELGEAGTSKILLINRCGSEVAEDKWMDRAKTSGVDLHMITSRTIVYYGGFASIDATLLSALAEGNSWSRVLERLPGRVYRSQTVDGNGSDIIRRCKEQGGQIVVSDANGGTIGCQ